MLPPLPHLYSNHCTICCNLDYNYYCDFRWVKKEKVKVKKPFHLSKVPNHLLDAIIVKMHYTAFTTFRQTNKPHSKYVSSNRAQLRVAMLHDMEIHLITRKKNIPWLKFSSRYFWDEIRDSPANCGNLDKEVELLAPKKQTALQYFLKCNAGKVIFRRRPVFVRILDFETKKRVRKELIGCYKPVSVTINKNFKIDRNIKWDSLINRFINFLKWSRITESSDISLDATDVNLSIIVQLCAELHPRTAILSFCDYQPRNFLAVDCFQHTKALYFRIPDLEPEALRNFEAVQTSGCCLTSEQFLFILQDWTNGNSKIREMWMRVNDAINCLKSVSAKVPSLCQYCKYIKTVIGFNYMAGELFILQQTPTGARAVCAVVCETSKSGKSGEYRVYFKVVDA